MITLFEPFAPVVAPPDKFESKVEVENAMYAPPEELPVVDNAENWIVQLLTLL